MAALNLNNLVQVEDYHVLNLAGLIYVPIVETGGYLDVPVAYAPQSEQLSFLRPTDLALYQLDLAGWLRVAGQEQAIAWQPIRLEDDVFVPLSFLAEAMAVTATWNFAQQTVFITTERPLTLLKDQGQATGDAGAQGPEVLDRRPFFSLSSLAYEFSQGLSLAPDFAPTETGLELSVNGQILQFPFGLEANLDWTQEHFTAALTRFHLTYAIDTMRIVLGDDRLGWPDLIDAANLRGLSATAWTKGSRTSRLTLQGTAPPGSEAVLLLNGSVYGRMLCPDGVYRFPQVYLAPYQPNLIEIRITAPDGRIRTIKRTIIATDDMMAKGSLSMAAGSGWATGSDSNPYSRYFSLAGASMGVAEWLTLSAAVLDIAEPAGPKSLNGRTGMLGLDFRLDDHLLGHYRGYAGITEADNVLGNDFSLTYGDTSNRFSLRAYDLPAVITIPALDEKGTGYSVLAQTRWAPGFFTWGDYANADGQIRLDLGFAKTWADGNLLDFRASRAWSGTAWRDDYNLGWQSLIDDRMVLSMSGGLWATAAPAEPYTPGGGSVQAGLSGQLLPDLLFFVSGKHAWLTEGGHDTEAEFRLIKQNGPSTFSLAGDLETMWAWPDLLGNRTEGSLTLDWRYEIIASRLYWHTALNCLGLSPEPGDPMFLSGQLGLGLSYVFDNGMIAGAELNLGYSSGAAPVATFKFTLTQTLAFFDDLIKPLPATPGSRQAPECVVTGCVFRDDDGDLVRDEGEPGLPGISLYARGSVTKTGADGNYLFTGLPEGESPIGLVMTELDADYTPLTPAVLLVHLHRGSNERLDFAITVNGSVTGSVLFLPDKKGEPGKPAAGVFLLVDGKRTCVTDGRGVFYLDTLPLGSHEIEIVPTTLPAGYKVREPARQRIFVTAEAPNCTGVEFFLIPN